jgi:hypothetical protein
LRLYNGLRSESRHIPCGKQNASRFPMEEQDPLTERIHRLRHTGALILNFNKAVLKAGIKRVTRFD